jgi:hypothetical protein
MKGLNIILLNYSDGYADMMLDFSINYNKNQIVNCDENSLKKDGILNKDIKI